PNISGLNHSVAHSPLSIGNGVPPNGTIPGLSPNGITQLFLARHSISINIRGFGNYQNSAPAYAIPPRRFGAIKSPSKLVYTADTPSYDNPLTASKDNTGQGYFNASAGRLWPNYRWAPIARHNDSVNCLFVDGHASTIKDATMSKWMENANRKVHFVSKR